MQLQNELQIRNYSKSTVDGYTCAISNFLKFCKGKTGDLISLGKAYSLHMRNIGRSPRGANVEIYAIRFFCEFVLKQPLPEGAIPRQKEPQSLPQIFSKEEMALIFKHTINPRHRLLIAMGYGSGLRVNEVIHIRAKDFNSSFSALRVRGKGQKDRIVPIDVSMGVIAKQICQTKKPDDFLFGGQKPGHYISETTAGKVLGYACARAGIRYRSYHKLRHSFATHVLEGGTDIVLLTGNNITLTVS